MPQGVGDITEAVLATALEAFVSIDRHGTVVAWNPAAEATFGYSRDEALGRTIEELIIPPGFREAHRQGLARLGAGGEARVLGQRLTLPACHRDGYEFPIDMALTATHDQEIGWRFHAFIQDVTVPQRVRRYAAVESAVSRELAEASGSGDAIERVCRALGVTLGWPVVELWLADEVRQVLVCGGRWYAPDRDYTAFTMDELEAGFGVPGRAWQDGRPLWVPSLSADSGFARSRLATELGLHAAVAVPIRSGGHILGVLAVYGESAEDPEDSLLALLGGLAAHVGQYLERRRAEELTVELARTRDEFVALVSHELRGPLAIITSTVALLSEEETSPEDQQRYLATIDRSAQRLAAMVDDLLDLARLESAQPTIHPQPTDLSKIVRQAVDAVDATTTRRGLTVEVDLPDSIPLHADGGRLRQVADNLLSNAVKYTPDGGRITIRAGFDDGHVVWTIADTGIGVPAAERSRLFRRFYRASTALERRIPGTGLGLVISRAIVERHQGTIGVLDHPGPGTTFQVRLPLEPPGQWP
jgi:PAS domain S-box-containing protein